ncbi:helix-turn-helix domain-containing protein [Humibacter soli]
MFAGLGLTCFGAGEFTGTAAEFRGRKLPSHGAVVVSAGRGWYSSDVAGVVAFSAPTLIWLFPGAEHGYWPAVDGWTEHWVLFGGAATHALDELAAWRRSAPVVGLNAIPPTLASTFSELRTALDDTSSVGVLRSSALCYSWIADLAAPSMRSSAPNVVETFTRESSRAMPMGQRARMLGMSVAELRKSTIESTGLTPLQLLIEARITRAQSLLAETDLEVNAIAARVGFTDPAYFTRQFARRRGISPSGFRQAQRRIPRPESEGSLVTDA